MSWERAARVEDFATPARDQSERRAAERFRMRLEGRYMLPDRSEFSCYSINISSDGALLHVPQTSEPGSRVVLYLEHIGALEGVVAWSRQDRLAVQFVAPPRKTDKIRRKIEALRSAEDAIERRDDERLLHNYDRVTIERADGALCIGRVEDKSAQGAAVITSARFRVGEVVVVEGRRAVVIRAFDNGIGVSFDA